MKKNKKIREKQLPIYILLRILVILCAIGQGLRGNWNNVALCILTLILFTLPYLISKKFDIELPRTLEAIVYLFIFSAEILGEIQNFYGLFTHWDTMLHTLNGFLCAAIGFSLVYILNNEKLHISMTPAFVALVAFTFSMTIGVLWEFGEFFGDRYFTKDMQKDRIVQKISSVELNKEGKNIPVIIEDITKTEVYGDSGKKIIVIEGGYLDIGIIDTMKDLFVNLIGAIVFSIFGYFYMKNKKKFKFLEQIIPKASKKSNV